MNHRPLGRSGLMVSELALGTMIFGEPGSRGADPRVSRQLVDRYLEAGGNHLDLANVYAGGESERILGQAIKGRRQELIVATKVRWPMGEGPNESGLSRHHILNSVEASLRRLDTDRIDLLYMHGWDPLTPLEETLRTFDDLITSGKVRYLGVSNFKAWQVMKAVGVSSARGWTPLVAAQYQYSLVLRDIEHEFPDLLTSEGMGLVPWGPLGGGFLTGKYSAGERPTEGGRIATTGSGLEESWERRATERNWRILRAVEEVAKRQGATVSQVALAWLLARPSVASVIVGARTMEQLVDNLGASALQLGDEDVIALANASQPDSLYPYRIVNSEHR